MKDIDKELDEILELYGLKAIASIDDKGLDNAKASTKQAIKQLINQARIDELEKIMNGQKTLRSFITNDGGEEQIIIYEIDNAEIQDRLAELKRE